MALVGRTFESATVTAKADGGLYQGILGDGIIWGCAITVASSAITIQAGEIMVGGRVAHFDSAYSYSLSPSVSSGYGRLVLNAKLDETTPVYLSEEYSTTQSFNALTQEAINNTGNLYQVELAVFSVSSSAAGSITSTIGSAKGGSCLLNAFYPVGSIYMSVNDVNPSTFMGGTWVSWGSGRVPVGVSSDSAFNSVEKTGGEKTHIITSSEMPSHTHSATVGSTSLSHNHDFKWTNPNTGFGLAQSSYHSEVIMLEGNTETGETEYYDGSHTHTVTIGSTGSGSAMNNLQPYITCYMWKRTA